MPNPEFTKSPIHQFRASVPGEVAQLVEHTTENRSVDSSILSLATNFSNILEGLENRQPQNPRRVTNG